MTLSPTPRTSGILLHPSSLPGPYGIGDFGPSAYAWIDTLRALDRNGGKFSRWDQRATATHPTNAFPHSPATSICSVRNCWFRKVSFMPPSLPAMNFRTNESISNESFRSSRQWSGKPGMHYRAGQATKLREPFESFCNDRKSWLDDFALFMALKDARRGESWQTWPAELLRREGSHRFLDFTRQELSEEVGYYQFGQFLFFRQWTTLKEYAHVHNVKLIGDVPIFVSPDSADVWANPKLFLLDGAMRPKVVAGVPPDYFSPTGQLWGNPLYDWTAMRAAGYRWWIQRLRARSNSWIW